MPRALNKVQENIFQSCSQTEVGSQVQSASIVLKANTGNMSGHVSVREGIRFTNFFYKGKHCVVVLGLLLCLVGSGFVVVVAWFLVYGFFLVASFSGCCSLFGFIMLPPH